MNRILDYIFEHKKFYLVLLIILVLNIVFLYFLTLNEYNLYHNTANEISKVDKELKLTRKNYSKLERVLKNVSLVKKEIVFIKKKKLKTIDKDFPSLTGNIYAILSKYNVTFQHISYSKKLLRNLGVIKVVVHIPIKTTYYNFRRCLIDFEGMDFPVIIDRISINAVEGNSTSATIDLAVYYKGGRR